MLKRTTTRIALLAAFLAWEALGQSTEPPNQVNVAVKIIEFQTNKDVDTGLSAYFARVNKERAYNRVTSGNGAITTADITFPTSAGRIAHGLTVFLDRINLSEGDIEIVLQALVNEGRATILSRPRALVMVSPDPNAPMQSVIQTVLDTPYANPTVVGDTVVTTTAYRQAGINLMVAVPQIWDADGDWNTPEDSYIRLNVMADAKELGADQDIGIEGRVGGNLTAPIFLTRQVETQVWVRSGQVFMLGGLYKRQKNKSLRSVPWLSQAEDVAVATAERVVPGNLLGSPISATIGNRSTSDARRELVFLIKAEIWRPAYTVADTHGFPEPEPDDEDETKKRPTDVIEGVLEGLSEIPRGIGEKITGEEDTMKSSLGGSE